ncbi:hypothetical protein FEM48_Zijuj04G0072000 [Ziziphus jujuba var. spinosa]|uniref:Uncharacterized protein n=1 Tax=Ziziphus jujuba var. spinosa TaxID=714518 RepID=A0A978VII6_ZIZJJ|nr:hypothetical protein FEM48_Zijuj04G0072000 [Ziziphus jujuba var. spinosa]
MSPFTSTIVQVSSSDVPKNAGEVMVGMKTENSSGWAGNLMLMMELRKKTLTFRDIIDLPPCNGSSPIHELVMGTVEDLHNLYPNVFSYNQTPEILEKFSIDQGLVLLYKALNCIGDSWAKNHKSISNLRQDSKECFNNISLEQLGRLVLEELKYITDMAKEIFNVMDEDETNNNDGRIQDSTIGDTLIESYSDKRMTCPSPNTTISVPPQMTSFAMKLGEISNISYSPQLLLPLRLQSLGNLKTNEMKYFAFNVSHPQQGTNDHESNRTIQNGSEDQSPEGKEDTKAAENLPKFPGFDSNVKVNITRPAAAAVPPPPLPPMVLLDSPPSTASQSSPSPSCIPAHKGSALPSMPMKKIGTPPPPPPMGVSKLLRPKKVNNKLKRSSHMGALYRILKGKVEGSSLSGKHSHGKKSHVSGSAGGRQGMADALAEMTKRSAYFQQIEEDVVKHLKSIMEIKAAMNSFQTKDMAELIRFHKYVEQHLEKLTDETQVLARFEDFPTKKLESLRTAAALYTKLEGIITTLENWKIAPPLGLLLDKVESYFNKIKGDVDSLERSKDEDSKRFRSHKIDFDFNILLKVKESMVDVSSSCMELALEEKRRAKAAMENAESVSKTEGQANHVKLLWRAFQLAFRVYSFAGGQDDRAEMLTKELAHEIETGPQH